MLRHPYHAKASSSEAAEGERHSGNRSMASVGIPMRQQLDAAAQQLEQLRLQQQALEQQKELLEGLRLRQDRLIGGRRALMERLEGEQLGIAEDLESCHQQIELLVQAHEDYQFHLRALRAQQPESWQREELDLRLDQALEELQAAEECFEKTELRLRAVPVRRSATRGLELSDRQGSMRSWLLRGLCLHAPLLAVALFYFLTR
jgi:hypothetical protein